VPDVYEQFLEGPYTGEGDEEEFEPIPPEAMAVDGAGGSGGGAGGAGAAAAATPAPTVPAPAPAPAAAPVPAPAAAAAGGAGGAAMEGKVVKLMELGFDRAKCLEALGAAGGNEAWGSLRTSTRPTFNLLFLLRASVC